MKESIILRYASELLPLVPEKKPRRIHPDTILWKPAELLNETGFAYPITMKLPLMIFIELNVDWLLRHSWCM